tara:strand:+ start:304 stop:483 length:180 start_codon:yes stop_codon:yes gene_type:complete
MTSRFGIEVEVLEEALLNMIIEGYMSENDTIEDLEDMAYSCCEGIEWYAKSKIYDWANN